MKKKKRKENYQRKNMDTNEIKATVVKIMNKQAQVRLEEQIVSCLLPQALVSEKNALVVGDRVIISPVGDKAYKLTSVLPRETEVFRGNRRSPGENILIVANVHYLLAIVTAAYFQHQAGYLEAAAIAARRSGIQIIFFISKWDLLSEKEQGMLENKVERYRTVADFVFTGPAHGDQQGLIEAVSNKTGVIVGDRFSGKTTLINEILSQLGESENGPRPLPSTHSSELVAGGQNTWLIATPGFRDFALQSITEQERNAVYPEIARLAEDCGFGSCTHTNEENCAVIQALREQRINRERYDAYQRMGGKLTKPLQKPDYRYTACTESFVCKVCGEPVVPQGAGSQHRNHCSKCLSSLHVDNRPGDRASLCRGVMEPVSVWVRKNGEWAIIHRCRLCGALSSNRIAADDNPALLMSIAVKPLARTPFPLSQLEEMFDRQEET